MLLSIHPTYSSHRTINLQVVSLLVEHTATYHRKDFDNESSALQSTTYSIQPKRLQDPQIGLDYPALDPRLQQMVQLNVIE